jgi:diguanylate cyclase
MRVAVNVSARQLQQPDFVQQVATALAESGLQPGLLELEITEGAAMRQPSSMAAILRDLKRLGVRLAIDDFGTGYSSLSYLQRFPVDTLKVDQSFVSRLGHDHESTAIVRTIVALAQALDVSVTAEGAETPEQVSLLRDLGCTLAQGFYFSKPLPGDEALRAIKPETAFPKPRRQTISSRGTRAT